jgi:MoaA/NifB/PqqE/SkfB family radical SAM enzyme
MSKRLQAGSTRPAGAPRRYECHLDYDCNRSCRFCSLERLDRSVARAHLSFKQLHLGLRAAAAAGCKTISFLGGEPTLRPDLARLVTAAAKAGFGRITLFSNGIRFSSRDYARRLADAGLDAINLNIPSHEEKIFDCLTGQPGGFPLLLEAVANLSRLGLSISATCVLNRLNYTKLPAYAAFYADLGIKAFTLNQLKFQGRLNPALPTAKADIGRLKVKMTDCAPRIEAMNEYCLGRGLYPLSLQHFVQCAFPGRGLPIAGTGKGRAPAGRGLFSIHPDLNGASALNLGDRDKVKLASCARCLYFKNCPGIEKNYLDVFGAAEFKPVKRLPAISL